MKKLLVLIIICYSQASFASNNFYFIQPSKETTPNNLDSIRNLFNQAVQSENSLDLARTYTQISNYISENPESVAANGLLLRIETALQNLDDVTKQAESYRNAGQAFYRQGKYTYAMESFLKALELSEESQDQKHLGLIHFYIGLVYMRVNEANLAIYSYESALKYSTSIGDTSNLKNTYWALGNAYNAAGNYLKAIESFNYEQSLVEKGNDLNRLALVHNRLGLSHQDMGDFSTGEYHLQQSILFYKAAGNLNLAEQREINLGRLYVLSGNPKKGIPILISAAEQQNIRGNLEAYHIASFALGLAYQKLDNYDSSIYFFERTKKLLEDSNTPNSTFLTKNDLLLQTYDHLSNLYENIHDYESAFAVEKAYADLNDQIINDPTRERVVELGNQYELRKAQEEVARLESLNSGLQNDLDAEYRNRITWALGGAAFTVMLLVLVFVLQRQSTIQSLIARLKS